MYSVVKRLLDILSSLMVLIVLLPFLLVIAILILSDSKGGIFYKQERIGKNQKPFYLYKFRSMRPESDKGSKITIGSDPRITKIGAFIRQFKIDELPQLINIVKGEMSVVGPRPEVKQYVQLYTEKQLRVLTVKPGLTDFASIQFFNEQEILGKAEDPQKKYIEEVMPQKLELNLHYIEQASFKTDVTVIFRTLLKIIS
jgi:lipopolysaccharide/colanic/teichoic acid biosynthesis glycosyltransferase